MKDVFISLLGFLFALILFYLQERWKDINKNRTSAKLMRRELEYDILLINQWIKNITQDLYFLTWGHPIFILSPRYDLFQNIFINKGFDSGLIYDLLNNDQIDTISRVLSLFTTERKQVLLNFINKYKEVELIDDEGTTGKDYIEMRLQDELKIIQDMRSQIEAIIPSIEYETNTLMYKLFRVGKDIVSKLKINY